MLRSSFYNSLVQIEKANVLLGHIGPWLQILFGVRLIYNIYDADVVILIHETT